MNKVMRWLCLLALGMTASCSESASPTSPGGMVTGVEVSGKVHDGDGREVGQARVTAVNDTSRVETTSDVRGEYRLQMGRPPYRLEVERDGYEAGWHPVVEFAARASLTRNLRLHPIARLGVGTSLSVSILPEDGHCVYDVIESAACRRVRVVSSGPARLIVDASDAFGETPSHEVWLQTERQAASPGQPIFLTMQAGGETTVEVLAVRLAGASALVNVRLDARPQ